jgi:CO/xanthine dehydrogenase Mo-binding subunit
MKQVTPKPLPPVNLPELRTVGKPLRRIDAIGKTVGDTLYAGDFFMSKMLQAKVFRSSVPHARIKHLDVSKARQVPGVVCVLTSTDLPQSVLVTDMPGQTGQKRRSGSDAHVLASDIVRFIGDPIALVAAEDLFAAEQALKLIEIEYELLPAVYDPLEAMQPGAPIVSEPDNIVARWKMRRGDVQTGFAAADLIVENTFKVPFVDHAYIEPEAGIAWVDEKGNVNIRVCTQVIEHFRSIALALNIPQNKLHIQGTMVGGGFGGKEDITVEIFIGLLAIKTNRPVRMEYTREESILAHSKRHPFTITHKTGVTKEGRITAAEIKLVADSGAYVYLSPYVLLYATGTATGPYKVDNIKVDSFAVTTNNPFTSAFRGFGAPQACFAYEQQMELIAKALGMDPYEFRCKNYMKTGDLTCNGQEVKTAAWLEETASRAIAALGDKTPETGVIKIGQGFASYMQSYGRISWFHDTSQSWVGLEMDGSVTVRSGIPDLGAGQISAVAQIAAEILGVPLDSVTVYHTDSALTPLAGTSTATRQLYMSGNAVFQAASAVRSVLLDRASRHFEEMPEDLDLADSKCFVKADPKQSLPLSQLAAMCASEGMPLANLALFKAPFTDPIDPETGQGPIWPDFTFGAHAVEIAVDTETGEITLLKSVACHDIGRAINPAAVVGQIEGGGVQGLGYALMEDVKVHEGHTLTPSFSEYLIPTSNDVPTTQVIILESGSGLGPFGAKGIGEPALTPAAPAVANALADALGFHIHSLPLTPDKVLDALEKHQAKEVL